MTGLAHTTARLKRLRPSAPSPVAEPLLSMTDVGSFGPNPGALRMLSYRPKSAVGKCPLVVVLHGCTQQAEAFTRQAGWLTLADRYGFMVVAAEQTSANNLNRCFNWFEPQDCGRGQGEAASIAATVAHAVRTQVADSERVFVTGLSAGGAMALVMLATYPEVFAAGAVVAGVPFGVATGMTSAFGVMQGGGGRSPSALGELVRRAAPAAPALPRLAIWHGDADHTVRPQNAVDIARQWAAAHGLAAEPTREDLSRWTRFVWREPGADRVLVELNRVPGLGHGVPLSTIGDDGIGATGPYMLEAGIASTLEIARFFGLAEGAAAVRTVRCDPQGGKVEAVSARVQVGDQVMAQVSPHVPPAVEALIEKALRVAGLRGPLSP